MAPEQLIWHTRLAPLGQRIITLSRLLEMASYQLDRTKEEARTAGQALLLDAAAEAETLHAELRSAVEDLAK